MLGLDLNHHQDVSQEASLGGARLSLTGMNTLPKKS